MNLDEHLARYADGDRGAFDPLFAEAWPIVVRFCRRYVGNPTEAEDVAQRTMIKLAQQAPHYDRERPALSWILTIAAWEARTARRKAQRHAERVVSGAAEDSAGADPGLSPESLALRRELGDALQAALERLSTVDRQTLLDDLHDHVDPDLRPAARRKRRQRALHRLRGIWRLTHGS